MINLEHLIMLYANSPWEDSQIVAPSCYYLKNYP